MSQHCEFGPWNILVGEGLIYLTDFGNFMVGIPAYDAAFFYSYLDLLSRYRLVDRALLGQMQAAFLEVFISNHARGMFTRLVTVNSGWSQTLLSGGFF